jgi:hypothetical protein
MTACPWEHLRYLTTWLDLHRYLCALSNTERVIILTVARK